MNNQQMESEAGQVSQAGNQQGQQGWQSQQGQQGGQSTEAALFAEILNRLDAKQPEPDPSQSARTISLIELFYYMLSKLHWIVLGMIAGGILMGYYAINYITPVYNATAKLYIMGNTSTSIVTNLQIGTVLAMDYQEVFNTWEVHQMVNEELGTNYSYSALQSMIRVTNPEDTRILYITAYNRDSEMAAKIANAYAKAAKKFIVETMQTDEPSDFSIALVPSVSSGRNVTGNIIRGILFGTALVCGVLVMIFLLDNRPKSPEDIMRYANIPTLAVVPVDPTLTKLTKQSRREQRT